MPLIDVKDLSIQFHTLDGIVNAVDGVSFSINREKTLGIVGESGCGKSVTAQAIMRIIQSPPGKISSGEILFQWNDRIVDLAKIDTKSDEIRKIRGNEIAMIFQEPMTSLNPVYTIGNQIIEVIKLHQNIKGKSAKEKAIDMLSSVGIPSPHLRVNEFPHQLSGGMRQRAMIAMALSCNPSLLIADEPTTALDVTIQSQVLDLMNGLRERFRTAIMFITHDLGVIAHMADEVIVMYLGRVVESAEVRELFKNPAHPYARGLMNSIPSLAKFGKERLIPIEGMVPDLLRIPAGCGFAPRCPHAMDICRREIPSLTKITDNHRAACWLCESQ